MGAEFPAMLQGKCSECGLTDAVGSFKGVNSKVYCPRCAARLVELARQKSERVEVVTLIDPTVCYRCKADNGSQHLPLIGNLPYCAKCADALYHYPFPSWLKLSLAGLLVFLVAALVHATPFFNAGKNLFLGERLVAGRQYRQAIPQLQATLTIAPDCEKAVLLLAKAQLLSGDPGGASKVAAGHRQGRFKEGALASEVKRIFDRTGKAFAKAEEARKLGEQRKWDEAARVMRQAAELYPEFTSLAVSAESLEGSAAFERKDYDRFLAVAEKASKEHSDSPQFAAMLASALACKYAVTGNEEYRKRAEAMLGKARDLATPLSPTEPKADLAGWEERTRYRLKSREIIEPEEYDRRFHPKKAAR